jgi:hypothetical protein
VIGVENRRLYQLEVVLEVIPSFGPNLRYRADGDMKLLAIENPAH